MANPKPSYLKDYPKFREWFELNRDLNPDIDFENLRTRDEITKLYYHSKSGTINTIRPRGLFRKKDPFDDQYDGKPKPLKLKSDAMCVADDPDFMQSYPAELNPEIDITKLSITSRAKIMYPDKNGIMKKTAVFNIIRRIRNQKKKDALKQMVNSFVGDDPKIRKYLRIDDVKKIAKMQKSSSQRIPMECPEGHRFTATPLDYYYKNEDIYRVCPFCSGKRIVPGLSDAGTLDPTLYNVWGENDKDLSAISPCSAVVYQFKCQLCGHQFTKAMKNIAFRFPKCPECGDTGVPKNDRKKDKEIPITGIKYLARGRVEDLT